MAEATQPPAPERPMPALLAPTRRGGPPLPPGAKLVPRGGAPAPMRAGVSSAAAASSTVPVSASVHPSTRSSLGCNTGTSSPPQRPRDAHPAPASGDAAPPVKKTKKATTKSKRANSRRGPGEVVSDSPREGGACTVGPFHSGFFKRLARLLGRGHRKPKVAKSSSSAGPAATPEKRAASTIDAADAPNAAPATVELDIPEVGDTEAPQATSESHMDATPVTMDGNDVREAQHTRLKAPEDGRPREADTAASAVPQAPLEVIRGTTSPDSPSPRYDGSRPASAARRRSGSSDCSSLCMLPTSGSCEFLSLYSRSCREQAPPKSCDSGPGQHMPAQTNAGGLRLQQRTAMHSRQQSASIFPSVRELQLSMRSYSAPLFEEMPQKDDDGNDSNSTTATDGCESGFTEQREQQQQPRGRGHISLLSGELQEKVSRKGQLCKAVPSQSTGSDGGAASPVELRCTASHVGGNLASLPHPRVATTSFPTHNAGSLAEGTTRASSRVKAAQPSWKPPPALSSRSSAASAVPAPRHRMQRWPGCVAATRGGACKPPQPVPGSARNRFRAGSRSHSCPRERPWTANITPRSGGAAESRIRSARYRATSAPCLPPFFLPLSCLPGTPCEAAASLMTPSRWRRCLTPRMVPVPLAVASAAPDPLPQLPTNGPTHVFERRGANRRRSQASLALAKPALPMRPVNTYVALHKRKAQVQPFHPSMLCQLIAHGYELPARRGAARARPRRRPTSAEGYLRGGGVPTRCCADAAGAPTVVVQSPPPASHSSASFHSACSAPDASSVLVRPSSAPASGPGSEDRVRQGVAKSLSVLFDEEPVIQTPTAAAMVPWVGSEVADWPEECSHSPNSDHGAESSTVFCEASHHIRSELRETSCARADESRNSRFESRCGAHEAPARGGSMGSEPALPPIDERPVGYDWTLPEGTALEMSVLEAGEVPLPRGEGCSGSSRSPSPVELPSAVEQVSEADDSGPPSVDGSVASDREEPAVAPERTDTAGTAFASALPVDRATAEGDALRNSSFATPVGCSCAGDSPTPPQPRASQSLSATLSERHYRGLDSDGSSAVDGLPCAAAGQSWGPGTPGLTVSPPRAPSGAIARGVLRQKLNELEVIIARHPTAFAGKVTPSPPLGPCAWTTPLRGGGGTRCDQAASNRSESTLDAASTVGEGAAYVDDLPVAALADYIPPIAALPQLSEARYCSCGSRSQSLLEPSEPGRTCGLSHSDPPPRPSPLPCTTSPQDPIAVVAEELLDQLAYAGEMLFLEYLAWLDPLRRQLILRRERDETMRDAVAIARGTYCR